jgi:AcrR family transcriptional regulator
MIPDISTYDCKRNERPSRIRRRHTILEATQTLCHQVGYEAMTMEAIAEEARITKPTLYAYFPNKEELAVEALVESLEVHLAFLQEMLDSDPDAVDFSSLLHTLLIGKLGSGRVTLAWPSHPVSEHPRFLATIDKFVTLGVTLLRNAQERGGVNPKLHPEATVQAHLAFVMNPRLELLIHAGALPAHETIETLHTILVNGLKPE